MLEVYEYDSHTAEQNHQYNMWLFSGIENECCRNDLERFLGMKKAEKDQFFGEILENYGLDRLQWVLAFSIRANAEHFNENAIKWADSVIPENYPMHEAKNWILHNNFGEISAIAESVAWMFNRFHLLNRSACSEKINGENVAENLLILNPKLLQDGSKSPQAQYFYATGIQEKTGYVEGYFLANGQKAEFEQRNFLGIADAKQLPEWAKNRLSEIQSPKMKIRIFQIDHEKDPNRLSFSNYDETMQFGGINSAIYRQIYGGTVNCADLESLFVLCNQGQKPAGYYGHSLSVSDVIQVCDGENKGFYFCDSVGFKPIDFNISQTDHDKMLRVLILECNKEPYIAEIQDCLKAKQSVVGGLIEPVYFDKTNETIIYCDEEFLLKGCEPNRFVGEILIHSTFMIVGNGENEEGEGIETSLTDEQIEKFSEQFRYPLVPIPKFEQNQEESQNFGFSSM
ncbi:MAG: YodL domain-containing protein [Oscillospiraceae bacterium]